MHIHIDNDFYCNLNAVDTQKIFDRMQGLDTGDAKLDQGNMNGIKVTQVGNSENKVRSSAQKRRNSDTVTEALREVDLVGATGAIKYRKTASETDALICGSDKMSTTIQEDTQKLLQQIIKIKDPLKWQTMFSNLIYRHLIEAQAQEQKRNLYSIVIKNMTDFINSTPNASENLASIRLDKNSPHNKRLILLFYWKLKDCKTSYINRKTNMCADGINRVTSGSKLCSSNLYTLVKSYNSIFSATILSKNFTKELASLQRKVGHAINTIEKINLVDKAITDADIEVQKIYKESSYFVSENKVNTVAVSPFSDQVNNLIKRQ